MKKFNSVYLFPFLLGLLVWFSSCSPKIAPLIQKDYQCCAAKFPQTQFYFIGEIVLGALDEGKNCYVRSDGTLVMTNDKFYKKVIITDMTPVRWTSEKNGAHSFSTDYRDRSKGIVAYFNNGSPDAVCKINLKKGQIITYGSKKYKVISASGSIYIKAENRNNERHSRESAPGNKVRNWNY